MSSNNQSGRSKSSKTAVPFNAQVYCKMILTMHKIITNNSNNNDK